MKRTFGVFHWVGEIGKVRGQRMSSAGERAWRRGRERSMPPDEAPSMLAPPQRHCGVRKGGTSSGECRHKAEKKSRKFAKTLQSNVSRFLTVAFERCSLKLMFAPECPSDREGLAGSPPVSAIQTEPSRDTCSVVGTTRFETKWRTFSSAWNGLGILGVRDVQNRASGFG